MKHPTSSPSEWEDTRGAAAVSPRSAIKGQRLRRRVIIIPRERSPRAGPEVSVGYGVTWAGEKWRPKVEGQEGRLGFSTKRPRIPQKVNHSYPRTCNSTPACRPKRNKNICPQENLHRNVPGSIIDNKQKAETNQMNK